MQNRPEDKRAKIPALIHMKRLSYEYLSIHDMESGVDYDADTNIFYKLFLNAINKINDTDKNENDIKKLIQEIKNKLSNNDLGKSFYECLETNLNDIKLIDFENISNNSFYVVTELPYANGDDNFRPDITVLINGMPLSFIEVKRQNNKDGMLAEKERMEKDRFNRSIYRKFVNITQIVSFSNNMEYEEEQSAPISGSFYAASSYDKLFFNKFIEENKNEITLVDVSEKDQDFILNDNSLISCKWEAEFINSNNPNSPLNKFLSSIYSKERIIFLLKYGICYQEKTDNDGIKKIEKHIMRYPQFNASKALLRTLDSGAKKGVIWHTQGSGKTELTFYCVKLLREYFQKKDIISKFYFIVDRIDLANQAKDEFEARGLHVNMVASRDKFEKEIQNKGETNNKGENTITVVNIQKFTEDSKTISSIYNVNVQNIYFLDEAHRSYNPKGSFLGNLLTSDKDAIKIALTGTPLIRKDVKTKEIFGNYIHKYYYNDSIRDGYTLRLIREDIEISYKEKLSLIYNELQTTHNIPKEEVFSHNSIVKPLCEYILVDFKKAKDTIDKEIGAMIVCDTSSQARKVYDELKKGEYSAALILHNEGSKVERKDFQADFKKGEIDILVVYNMLLTGFDSPRLKKLYLARVIREHNLLQTLARVNRPFKSMSFGYVVDFADISDEFRKTNSDYLKELTNDMELDEATCFSGFLLSEDEITKKIDEVKNILFEFDDTDIQSFVEDISTIKDTDKLTELKKALIAYRELYNQVRTSEKEEHIKLFDLENVSKLINEVTNRINVINLVNGYDDTSNILNELDLLLNNISFHFAKRGEEELKIVDALTTSLQKAHSSTENGNFDKDDPESISLREALRKLLKEKNIEEIDISEMKDLIEKINSIRKNQDEINRKNDNLKKKYKGDEKYVRVHKRTKENNYMNGVNDRMIYKILNDAKTNIDTIITNNSNIIDSEIYFYKQIVGEMLKEFDKEGIEISSDNSDAISKLIFNEYMTERRPAA